MDMSLYTRDSFSKCVS